MFVELEKIIPEGGAVTVSLTKKNGILCAAVLPRFPEGSKVEPIQPLMLRGTAEQLDSTEWANVTRLAQPVHSLAASLRASIQSLEANKGKLDATNKKAGKPTTPETTAPQQLGLLGA
ncbi:hypothetical protein DA2_0738 [Desulfovibrio sp. A2]|nr:hypothetical protein DA2_0738 [Desulfovibrio sp. A2]